MLMKRRQFEMLMKSDSRFIQLIEVFGIYCWLTVLMVTPMCISFDFSKLLLFSSKNVTIIHILYRENCSVLGGSYFKSSFTIYIQIIWEIRSSQVLCENYSIKKKSQQHHIQWKIHVHGLLIIFTKCFAVVIVVFAISF